MDREDLEIHLENIASGRDEDQYLEWKRQWWDFKRPEEKDEFRRDVAAMANGSQGDISGYIIIGVKGARLYDSAMILDEADLQNILGEIDPIPNVSFEEHRLNFEDSEVVLIVVEIKSPFDKPYVCKQRKQNIVPVRHGSKIDNASRKELDRFYVNRGSSRQPDIQVSWVTGGHFMNYSGRMWETDVLELNRYPDCLIEKFLQAKIKKYIETLSHLSKEEAEKIHNQLVLYIDQFKSSRNAQFYWCQKKCPRDHWG